MAASSKTKATQKAIENVKEGELAALTILWCWANCRIRRLMWVSFGLAIAGIGFAVAGFFWQPAFQVAWAFVIVNFILIAYILGIMTVKSKALDMTVEVLDGETESKQA